MKLLNLISGTQFKRSFLAAAVAASCATSAFALPVFTFNPGTLCAAGTTCSSITADNILISDFAQVTLTSPTTFTESGYLKVTGFQLGSAQVMPAGFNSNYSLYIPFSGTGHLTSTNTSFTTDATAGQFDTLTYQLIGASGNVPGTSAFDSGTVLGNGSLKTGFVGTSRSGSAPGFIPTANVDVSFNVLNDTFFVSPVPFYNLGFAAFTNTSTQIALTGNGFTVTQGGGILNFGAAVPEPTTVALLGLGLLGVAASRRKSAKNKNA